VSVRRSCSGCCCQASRSAGTQSITVSSEALAGSTRSSIAAIYWTTGADLQPSFPVAFFGKFTLRADAGVSALRTKCAARRRRRSFAPLFESGQDTEATASSDRGVVIQRSSNGVMNGLVCILTVTCAEGRILRFDPVTGSRHRLHRIDC